MPYPAGLAVAVLIVVGWFKPDIGDRWLRALEDRASRVARKRRLAVVAVGLAAVFARLALVPLQPVPLPVIHDEFSNLLAADTFAHGRLTNPPHPMSVFFDTFHVLQHPTYASKYPPAAGAELAIGQVLGHPWIGTLLGLAAMCMAITWMLQGWFPAPWALLGASLAVLRMCFFNYWFDGYFGASVAALGSAVVLGSYPRIVHSGRGRDAVLLGVGAVLLASSRPLEGFVFCLPIAIALGFGRLSRRKPALPDGLRCLWPTIVVLSLGLVFLGYYNWRLTNHPLLSPYVLYHREYFNYPFFAWQGPRAPLHYANPQFETFFNVWHRTEFRLSWSAWARRAIRACRHWWYVYLGLPLTIPFLALPRIIRDRKMGLPVLQFAVGAAGLWSVVWFQPHYAAPLVATLFVLLVQAMRHLRQFECRERPVGIYLTRLVLLLAIDWVVVLAGQAVGHPSTPWTAARAQITEQLQSTPGEHLVLVEYALNHNVHHEWVYNAADIDGSRIVWAREIPGQDLGPLLAYFKNRKIWVVSADASPPTIREYRARSPWSCCPPDCLEDRGRAQSVNTCF